MKADRYLDPYEVAQILNVDRELLNGWRSRRVGPPFVKMGHRTIRYSEAALEEWLKRNTQATPGRAIVDLRRIDVEAIPHGTEKRYRYGCSCDECRTAHATRARNLRKAAT